MINNLIIDKRGQATIFIIVALIIAVGVGAFVIIQKGKIDSGVPEQFQEVYSYYDECIRQNLGDVVSLVESQGGRVDPGTYAPGSEYAPFSSQLNFLGFPVSYWFYTSGNGLVKENVPTKSAMKLEMENTLEKLIGQCDFEAFEEKGYLVELGDVSVKLNLRDDKVVADVNADLKVEKNGQEARVGKREIEINSKLGMLFDEALRVYDKQKNEMFLENLSVDVMRLYAPVDGVLVQCNPEVWTTQDVFDGLHDGLEANIAALKFGNKKEGDYFTVEHSYSGIRALYSKEWPNKIEIHGDGVKDGAMIADVVGNQQGMGVMGFCYVPYHFVYDLSFPVILQVYDGLEIFQFPVVVIIDKNLPRQGVFSETDYGDEGDFDFCAAKTQNIQVKTYDAKLNAIDARISYTCFDQKCDIGKTKDGILDAMIPSCINGILSIEAENYSEQELEFSSNEEDKAEIVLDRIYDVETEVIVDGSEMKGTALVSFEGKITASAALPQSKNVRLAEGEYTIRVYVYGNSSITIPASNSQQCVEVSSGGLAGLFGSKEEKCFDVNLPETKIEYALLGGGLTNTYIFPEDLEKGKIRLDVSSLKAPKSLADLQTNYELYETKNVGVTYG